MKLAMLSEASQSWKQMQERGFEQATEHAATAVHKFVTRSLAARDSSSTCKADDDSAQCQKPTTAGNTQTIAIVLGAGYVFTGKLRGTAKTNHLLASLSLVPQLCLFSCTVATSGTRNWKT